MPVEFINLESARTSDGLRMTVVTGVPSPWGEAAKAIFHVKKIPWKAVALDVRDAEMSAWTRDQSAPVAIYDDEAPRPHWSQILLLAERLAPTPSLLPSDPAKRAWVLGMSHEICGEGGLGWTRRLQGIHAGLAGGIGFPPPAATYLAGKYGYRADESPRYSGRVAELLEMLAARLHAQRQDQSPYYLGTTLTAVDIYSATVMALFKPLPQEHCAMPPPLRRMFSHLDETVTKALDPILLEHRDRIYNESLELPLTLTP